MQFHDYTLASPLERVFAFQDACAPDDDHIHGYCGHTGLPRLIHQAYRSRVKQQPTLVRLQASIKHRLQWRHESYLLQLYLPCRHLYKLPPSRQNQQQLPHQKAHTTDQPLHQQPGHDADTKATHVDHNQTGVSNTTVITDRDLISFPLASCSGSHHTSVGDDDMATEPSPVCATSEWTEPSWETGLDLDLDLDTFAMLLPLPPSQHTAIQLGDSGSSSRNVQQRSAPWGTVSTLGITPSPASPIRVLVTPTCDPLAIHSSSPRPDGSPAGQPTVGTLQLTPDGVEPASEVAALHPTDPTLPTQPPFMTPSMLKTAPLTVSTPALPIHASWWPYTSASENIRTPHVDNSRNSPGRTTRKQWWRRAWQHKLQRWFGVDHFLLLHPQSFSRRVLEEVEATALLAAASLASSSSCLLDPIHPRSGTAGGSATGTKGDSSDGGGSIACPMFIPVHDALRDAYWGVMQVPGCSVRFTTDSVHINPTSKDLMTLEGQLALFAQQMSATSPGNAAACLAALDRRKGAVPKGEDWCPQKDHPRLTYSRCSTFAFEGVYPPDSSSRASEEPEIDRTSSAASSATANVAVDPDDAWDSGSPWSPWAFQMDPVGFLELDVVWEDVPVDLGPASVLPDSFVNMTGSSGALPGRCQDPGKLQTANATHWLLHVVQKGLATPPEASLGLRPLERQRTHLELQRGGAPWLWTAAKSAALEASFAPLSHPFHPSATAATLHDKMRVASHTNKTPRRCSSTTPATSSTLNSSFTSSNATTMTGVDQGPALPVHDMVASPDRVVSTANLDPNNVHQSQHKPHSVAVSSVDPLHRSQTERSMVGHDPEGHQHSSHEDFVGQPRPGAGCDGPLGPLGEGCFTVMLNCMLQARCAAAAADSLGDLAGTEWWEVRGQTPPRSPSQAVLADVLHDLFHKQPTSAAEDTKPRSGTDKDLSSFPGTVPSGTLLSNLALHCLPLGNARAIAACWHSFVSELRFAFWETGVLLPAHLLQEVKEGEEPLPNPGYCLLHQKLQMLQLCLHRRQHAHTSHQSAPTTSKTTAAATAMTHPSQPATQHSRDTPWDSDSDWDADSDEWTVAEEKPPSLQPDSIESQKELRSGSKGGSPLHLHAQIQPDPEGFYSASEEQEEAGGGLARGVKHILLQPSLPSATALQDTLQPSPSSATGYSGRLWSSATPSAAVPVMLSCFPDRALCVPVSQPPVWLTADRAMERQAQFEALAGDPNGAEVLWRMNSLALSSDMSAFKAANPGAVLEDFLRWHSPKDVLPSHELSSRMGSNASSSRASPDHHHHHPRKEDHSTRDSISRLHIQTPSSQPLSAPQPPLIPNATLGVHSVHDVDEGDTCVTPRATSGPPPHAVNPWHTLWQAAVACPAWEQRPLQDPMLEGERVLHELETLHPAALFDTLVAASFAGAVGCLSSCDGARVESVAHLLQRFHGLSASSLLHGCAFPEASCANGSRGRDPMELSNGSQSWITGWKDESLEVMLAGVHFLEQVVVLSESLMLRLPGCTTTLAEPLMKSMIAGDSSTEDRVVFRSVAWVDTPPQRRAMHRILSGQADGGEPPSGKWPKHLSQPEPIVQHPMGQQSLFSDLHQALAGEGSHLNPSMQPGGIEDVGDAIDEDVFASDTESHGSDESDGGSEWHDAYHQEWVLTCAGPPTSMSCGFCGLGHHGSQNKGCPAVDQEYCELRMDIADRLYVQAAAGEMRIASTMVMRSS